VLDTRARAGTIRRRRECTVCGLRCTTYERVELPVDAVERTVLAYVRSLTATEEMTTHG
jgi:transcriptional regulator NrdR family protein